MGLMAHAHSLGIKQQRLRVPIWRTFPLAQTAAALDASITGHLNGKIVVLP
jgi:NADPH:quinone reductase-like Zn-dependent oxidoreductase